VLGIRTNIPFMLQLLQHPQFVTATIDTGFLDREGAAIAAASVTELPPAAHAAVAEHRRLFASGGGAAPLGGVPAPGSGDVDPFVSLRGWRG